MPIQFRCTRCGQLLSISRRKAGQEVTCPQCVHRITVPQDEAEAPSDMAPPDNAPEHLQLVSSPSAEFRIPGEPSAWDLKVNAWDYEEETEEDFRLGRVPLQESGLDMTPMVDVTFLLLIFFMITASFQMQKSLETSAPKPESDAAQSVVIEDLEDDSVIVEITEDNTIRVDDAPVAGLSELLDVLRNKITSERKTEMLIEAHPNAEHGTLVGVTDAGIEAQMQKIRSTIRGEAD